MNDLITLATNTPGKRIRLLREAKNLKQKDLAVRCKLSNSMLCKIEQDDKSPSVQSLAAIADALEVSMDFIQRGNQN